MNTTNNPIMLKDAPVITNVQLRHFLAIFGEPESVKQDLVELWQKERAQGHPPTLEPGTLFTELMDKRVKEGSIAREATGVLTALFSHSFAPEQGTDFLAKHCEPLLDGIARLYVKTIKPESPVWRIEGDISNLGGLNNASREATKALFHSDQAAFNKLANENHIKLDGLTPELQQEKLGRAMADNVLHAVCQLTRHRLSAHCDTVIPVRKGGDEISFIAVLKNEAPGTLEQALKQTQKDVASFVENAGLKLVEHGKHPNSQRHSGIGIGLHYVDLAPDVSAAENAVMNRGIDSSKAHYREVLHGDATRVEEITTPDLQRLDASVKSLGFKRTHPLHTVIPPLYSKEADLSPDDQRFKSLLSTLKSTKADGKLTPAEHKAAEGVHAIIREIDYVTGLPTLSVMEHDLLPHFINKFGAPPKLIHADFSNMAGGNALSDDLGNAMASHFADAFMRAASRSGFESSLDYIAVRPGGKFAMFVPGDTSEEKLKEFSQNVNQCLKEISRTPLDVPDDVKAAISAKIETKDALLELYGHKGMGGEASQGTLFDDQHNIHIPSIRSAKEHHLPGADVAVTYSNTPITPENPLDDQLRPLSVQADKIHRKIIEERQSNGKGGGGGAGGFTEKYARRLESPVSSRTL